MMEPLTCLNDPLMPSAIVTYAYPDADIASVPACKISIFTSPINMLNPQSPGTGKVQQRRTNVEWPYEVDGFTENVLLRSSNRLSFSVKQAICLRTPSSGPVARKPQISATKRRVICPICGDEMLQKTLKRHIHVKHNSQSGSHSCRFCDAHFSRKDILTRHQREQHVQDQRTIVCTYCSRQIRERSLDEHFKSRRCRSARASLKLDERSLGPHIDTSKTYSELSGVYVLPSLCDPLLACAHYCVTTRNALDAIGYIGEDSSARERGESNSTSVSRVFPTIFTRLLELRGIAIHLTRRKLKYSCKPHPMEDSEHDRTMITIALLAEADDYIFNQYSLHSCYLHSHHRTFKNPAEAMHNLRAVLSAAHRHSYFTDHFTNKIEPSSHTNFERWEILMIFRLYAKKMLNAWRNKLDGRSMARRVTVLESS